MNSKQGEGSFPRPKHIWGWLMQRPLDGKGYLGIGLMLVVALAVGPGCQEAKPPPSEKADAFCREIQSLINRIVPPLAGPVAQKDNVAINTALIRAFSLCAQECEDVIDNVFVLDKKGVRIAVHPPAKVERYHFANYWGVQRAFAERRPVQATLYRPDGKTFYYIFSPLIYQGQVKGILALGFKADKVLEKRGLNWEEFYSMDFRCP